MTISGRSQKTVMVVILFAVAGWWFGGFRTSIAAEPIKVGILHSLTGTMSISEVSVKDATLLAIDEINEAGGLLGRQIEPVVVDGRSDWPTFAEEAERLITEDRVSVVFGCWTSASRKTVKPVFEKYNHLLFYPVQYEGLEQSPNIIYTGAAPNQQIIPAVKWSVDNIGKRLFLVGSDYVFPRCANAIITDQALALGAEIVGEEYVLLGSDDVQHAIHEISELQPDVVLNTINGDTNLALFRGLRRAGISPDDIPVMSFSIAEDELRALGTENMVGNYACWNYFQSIDTARNADFVARFKKKYGADRVTDDPVEAGYFGVYLWAEAVKDAGTVAADKVRDAVKNQSFQAPEGLVSVDSENNHTWKTVRIGKIREDGQFDIVWTSARPIRPTVFPMSRSRSQWREFLNDLNRGWDGKWANPGPETASQTPAVEGKKRT